MSNPRPGFRVSSSHPCSTNRTAPAMRPVKASSRPPPVDCLPTSGLRADRDRQTFLDSLHCCSGAGLHLIAMVSFVFCSLSPARLRHSSANSDRRQTAIRQSAEHQTWLQQIRRYLPPTRRMAVRLHHQSLCRDGHGYIAVHCSMSSSSVSSPSRSPASGTP